MNEQQEMLHEFQRRTPDRGVVWIDDGTGRIIDELDVQSRIRSGQRGCQLCHEPLGRSQSFASLKFDDRGLPRLLFGVGQPVCIDCVEWVRWLQHYAKREPVGELRFTEDTVVLRAGSEELYQVTDGKLTGLPAAGVWFPAYRCQRIEVRGSSGEILPACLGLEFELADFELQPIPPRHPIGASRNPTNHTVDLVGESRRLPTIDCAPHDCRAPSIAQQPRRLLTGKGGGT